MNINYSNIKKSLGTSFIVMLLSLFIVASAIPAAAADNVAGLPPFPAIEIIYNGEQIASGYIDENGRTLVNLRWLKDFFLCQASGYPRFCQISRTGVSIGFTTGEYQMTIGETKKQIDTTARYFEVLPTHEYPATDQWNCFVPLRYVAEELGMRVDWDSESKRVFITEETDSVFDSFKQIPLDYWGTKDYVYTGGTVMIVEKITSAEEYTNMFGEIENYNRTFFENNYILIIAWQEGSGGDYYEVADVRFVNNKATVYITKRNTMGGIVLDVETSHTIAFEVTRDLLDCEFGVSFIYTVD